MVVDMTVADCVSMVIDTYVERDMCGCRPVAVLPSLAMCCGDMEGMADWALAAAAILAAGSDLRVESHSDAEGIGVDTGVADVRNGEEIETVLASAPVVTECVHDDGVLVQNGASGVVTPAHDGYGYLAAYEPDSWELVSDRCGPKPVVAVAFGPNSGGVFLPETALGRLSLVRTGDGIYGLCGASVVDTDVMSLSSVVSLLKCGAPGLLGTWVNASVGGVFSRDVPDECVEHACVDAVPVDQPSGYCYLACFSGEGRPAVMEKYGAAPALSVVFSSACSSELLSELELGKLWFVMDDGGHLGVWQGKPIGVTAWSVCAVFRYMTGGGGDSYAWMSDLAVGGVCTREEVCSDAVAVTSCFVCVDRGKPCWARTVDALVGRTVSRGASSLADLLDRLSSVTALLDGGDQLVRVFSMDGVCHVAVAGSLGASVGRTVCVTTLDGMLSSRFRAWFRTLASCRVDVEALAVSGRMWCSGCACVVRAVGHEDRCAPPRASEDVQVRNAAWFGDVAQAMDVRYCILAAGLPPAEATVRAVGYVSAEAQVRWAVQHGVDLRLPPDASLHRRSTRFEAQYLSLRLRYVEWLVADLGLEPKVGIRLLAGLPYSAFCDVIPGLDGCCGRRSSSAGSSDGGAVLYTPLSSDCGVVEVPWEFDKSAVALVLRCDNLNCQGYGWKSRTRFLRHRTSSHAGDEVVVVPPSPADVAAIRALHVGADVKLSGEDWRIVYRCSVPGCVKSTVEWFDTLGFKQHMAKH